MDGRRGGHDQGSKLRQRLLNLARQIGTLIFRLPGIDRAVLQAAGDNRSHHRIHLFRLLQHMTHRRGALGDPRAKIELLRQLMKGVHINRVQGGAKRSEGGERAFPGRLRLVIAKKLRTGGNGKGWTGGQRGRAR